MTVIGFLILAVGGIIVMCFVVGLAMEIVTGSWRFIRRLCEDEARKMRASGRF